MIKAKPTISWQDKKSRTFSVPKGAFCGGSCLSIFAMQMKWDCLPTEHSQLKMIHPYMGMKVVEISLLCYSAQIWMVPTK
jgi:hypothetical protein